MYSISNTNPNVIVWGRKDLVFEINTFGRLLLQKNKKSNKYYRIIHSNVYRDEIYEFQNDRAPPCVFFHSAIVGFTISFPFSSQLLLVPTLPVNYFCRHFLVLNLLSFSQFAQLFCNVCAIDVVQVFDF